MSADREIGHLLTDLGFCGDAARAGAPAGRPSGGRQRRGAALALRLSEPRQCSQQRASSTTTREREVSAQGTAAWQARFGAGAGEARCQESMDARPLLVADAGLLGVDDPRVPESLRGRRLFAPVA